MREYHANDIRNVAVVGHGGSGKTTLVDALAFVSGSSKRHGHIKDGTTLTDYSPEETERKYSINLGCAYAEWMDSKINLIDVPGYLDFQGDAIAGVKVDQRGNVYVSGPGGLWILDANGKHLGTLSGPEHPHNIAWGDAGRRTLYLAAQTGIYRLRLNVAGAGALPKAAVVAKN